jgi:hypothetical protein
MIDFSRCKRCKCEEFKTFKAIDAPWGFIGRKFCEVKYQQDIDDNKTMSEMDEVPRECPFILEMTV